MLYLFLNLIVLVIVTLCANAETLPEILNAAKLSSSQGKYNDSLKYYSKAIGIDSIIN